MTEKGFSLCKEFLLISFVSLQDVKANLPQGAQTIKKEKMVSHFTESDLEDRF